MKRILIYLSFLFFVSTSIFAQDEFLVKTWDFYADYIYSSGRMFYYDERFDEIAEVKYEGTIIDKYGYQYLIINNKSRLYIPNAPVEIDPEKTLADMNISYHNFLNFNIKSIKSSSMFTERIGKNIIEYNPNNMKSIYFQDSEQILWKKGALPWVEGNKGDGIGEKIEIEFEEKTNGFMILNGYVDPIKKEYYKYNNRVKKIRVYSLNEGSSISVEYEIPDYVHFFIVKLPIALSSIAIEILEVYKGEKYNDTCITAIIGREYLNENVKQIQNIKNVLYNKGILK